MKENSDFVEYHEIIECITCALDAKDPYTANHSLRVSNMVEKICRLIGLGDKDTEEIHIAAHLHDIGKIGVPDAILNKAGKLTEEEWKIMREHPKIGAQILSKSIRLENISKIVLYHHEQYNGKGYPEGIKGKNIPLGARIISICDFIDAMSTDRSYRKAFDLEYCYKEVQKQLGIMYDPDIGIYVLNNWNIIVGKQSSEVLSKRL